MEIHDCKLEAHIAEIDLNIKFSCTIFVSWKTASNKLLCKTIKEHTNSKDNKVPINENLSTNCYIMYDKKARKYSKQETSLNVYLISKRKPDE